MTKHKNNFGTIKIFTQKQKYYTCESINGTINLQLTQMVPTNMVELKFLGKEKVKMAKQVIDYEETEKAREEDEHENGEIQHIGYEYKTETEEDSEKLINEKMPFYGQFGNFQIGNNVIPFSFKIKDGLPSTFRYDYNYDGKACKAEISYVLEVCLNLPNSEKLEDDLKIELIETLPVGFNSFSFFNQNLDKGLEKKKDFDFTARLEKDFFIFGENAKVFLKCDNSDNWSDIKNLKWKFVQYLKFHTRDNQMIKFERNRITKEYLEKVKGGDKYEDSFLCNIKSSNKTGFHNVPSFKCKLIENVYKLEFYAVTRKMLFFSKDNKIEFEVKVLRTN